MERQFYNLNLIAILNHFIILQTKGLFVLRVPFYIKYLIFSYNSKRFCYLKLLDDITYMRVHQTNFRWKNCKRQSL